MSRQRAGNAQRIFWIVSLLVVSSMLIGLATTFTPPRAGRGTLTPTPTPTRMPAGLAPHPSLPTGDRAGAHAVVQWMRQIGPASASPPARG